MSGPGTACVEDDMFIMHMCDLPQIPSSGCTIVDLKDGVLRLEVLLGKMSYMVHLRE